MPENLNPYAELGDVNVACGAQFPCGFIVNDRYFEGKTRLGRTSCPNCGKGRLVVVDANLQPIPGKHLDIHSGRIV